MKLLLLFAVLVVFEPNSSFSADVKCTCPTNVAQNVTPRASPFSFSHHFGNFLAKVADGAAKLSEKARAHAEYYTKWGSSNGNNGAADVNQNVCPFHSAIASGTASSVKTVKTVSGKTSGKFSTSSSVSKSSKTGTVTQYLPAANPGAAPSSDDDDTVVNRPAQSYWNRTKKNQNSGDQAAVEPMPIERPTIQNMSSNNAGTVTDNSISQLQQGNMGQLLNVALSNSTDTKIGKVNQISQVDIVHDAQCNHQVEEANKANNVQLNVVSTNATPTIATPSNVPSTETPSSAAASVDNKIQTEQMISAPIIENPTSSVMPDDPEVKIDAQPTAILNSTTIPTPSIVPSIEIPSSAAAPVDQKVQTDQLISAPVNKNPTSSVMPDDPDVKIAAQPTATLSPTVNAIAVEKSIEVDGSMEGLLVNNTKGDDVDEIGVFELTSPIFENKNKNASKKTDGVDNTENLEPSSFERLNEAEELTAGLPGPIVGTITVTDENQNVVAHHTLTRPVEASEESYGKHYGSSVVEKCAGKIGAVATNTVTESAATNSGNDQHVAQAIEHHDETNAENKISQSSATENKAQSTVTNIGNAASAHDSTTNTVDNHNSVHLEINSNAEQHAAGASNAQTGDSVTTVTVTRPVVEVETNHLVESVNGEHLVAIHNIENHIEEHTTEHHVEGSAPAPLPAPTPSPASTTESHVATNVENINSAHHNEVSMAQSSINAANAVANHEATENIAGHNIAEPISLAAGEVSHHEQQEEHSAIENYVEISSPIAENHVEVTEHVPIVSNADNVEHHEAIMNVEHTTSGNAEHHEEHLVAEHKIDQQLPRNTESASPGSAGAAIIAQCMGNHELNHATTEHQIETANHETNVNSSVATSGSVSTNSDKIVSAHHDENSVVSTATTGVHVSEAAVTEHPEIAEQHVQPATAGLPSSPQPVMNMTIHHHDTATTNDSTTTSVNTTNQKSEAAPALAERPTLGYPYPDEPNADADVDDDVDDKTKAIESTSTTSTTTTVTTAGTAEKGQKTAPQSFQIIKPRTCYMLQNVKIAGRSLDQFFSLVTCSQEEDLANSITTAYIIGVKQRSIIYIMNKVENFLSMAYCRVQRELGTVLHAIKQEKLHNVAASKDYNRILKNIHKASRMGKRRLDFFLQEWKKLLKALMVTVDDPKKAMAVVGPVMQMHASSNGEQLARMLFKDLQELAVVVDDSAQEIAGLAQKKRGQNSPTLF